MRCPHLGDSMLPQSLQQEGSLLQPQSPGLPAPGCSQALSGQWPGEGWPPRTGHSASVTGVQPAGAPASRGWPRTRLCQVRGQHLLSPLSTCGLHLQCCPSQPCCCLLCLAALFDTFGTKLTAVLSKDALHMSHLACSWPAAALLTDELCSAAGPSSTTGAVCIRPPCMSVWAVVQAAVGSGPRQA